jgi:tol-pal system protein YbgF
MSSTTLRIACAALLAFSAAAPAFAQKLSLADRVARLEQQSSSQTSTAGQASTETLNRITQMQSEVQALRNQVEQLQNENAQLKQQGRDQYVDLDSRLQRMESGTAPAAAGSPALAPPPASSAPVRATTPGPRTSAPRTSAPLPPGAYTAPGAGEQGAYDAALAALRSGNYVESARSFQAYLRDYPDAALAPNAWYWLGESYYATQNYPIALQSFDTLLRNFPDSPKAPDALLKKGYCQIEMGDVGAGSQTLDRVINEFPGSDAARLAMSRMRALSLDPR